MAMQGADAGGSFINILVDAQGRLIIVGAAAAPLFVDVIDRAGRLVGIVYGENAQLQQLTPADGVTPNESLESISFGMVYDAVAGDWNRVHEGAVLGSVLTDLSDDWTRQVGQFDLSRYLGAAPGLANPVHIANVFGAAIVDPRNIRALAKATDEIYGVLRTDAGVAYDARDRSWNLGALDVPDFSDRWARLLGQIDLARVLGAALTSANPVITGVFDAAGNRMPSMDAAARPGFFDMTDRAVRLLGVLYGSQAQQLQQKAATFELLVEDTGLNTNPERWLHDNHWEPTAEIPIVLAGAPGQQNVGGAVPAGETRRIREVTVRHAGTNNTVVTILDAAAGNIKITIDVPPQSTVTWGSQDGRAIAATLQPVVQSSDVTGGNTMVSIAGVEST